MIDRNDPNLLDQIMQADPVTWAVRNQLKLLGGTVFSLDGCRYMADIMRDQARWIAVMKGTQARITTCFMSREIHALINRLYAQGAIYYFPTEREVEKFSKTRMGPLISDNPCIKRFLKNTNSVSIKRVGKSFLSLQGTSATSNIQGKKDGGTVRQTPADSIVRDEIDLFDETMAAMTKDRLLNSKLKREVDLGSPTIPDVGIDKIFCVVPETKILTLDLRWVQAGNLKYGDRLIGFDEEKLPSNKTRRYKETDVIECERLLLPCLKIYLDDGNSVIVSKGHKWLTEKSTNVSWKTSEKLIVGDKLFSIGMWEEDLSKDGGWLAGIFDGEGNVSRSKPCRKKTRGCASKIAITQNEGVILQRVETFLRRYGFDFGKSINKGTIESPKNCFTVGLKGGLPESLRFLGTFRPIRLLEKSSLIWNNVSVGNDHGNTKKPKVIKIEDVGEKEVVALGTTHKTFIANGLLSHNSKSDQKFRMIKCLSCDGYTCIAEEFPNSIKYARETTHEKYRPYFGCIKCGKKIDVANGEFVAKFPDRYDDKYPMEGISGYHVSHFITPNCNLSLVMTDYEEALIDGSKMGRFYNTYLGFAYIAIEDRLRQQDVFNCCGDEVMKSSSVVGTAMGADIMKTNRVVIAEKTGNEKAKIIYMARVSGFDALFDLVLKFHVKSGVVCIRPYEEEFRKFQERCNKRDIKIYGSAYPARDNTKAFMRTDDESGVYTINRTEAMDKSHAWIRSGKLEIPRNCDEVKVFAKEVCNVAKVLETNELTGDRIYKYRQVGVGGDHYRHCLNYLQLALLNLYDYDIRPEPILAGGQEEKYSPLKWGL